MKSSDTVALTLAMVRGRRKFDLLGNSDWQRWYERPTTHNLVLTARYPMLNLRQIEVFNALMNHKGVTAAAIALRSSQPTISRELREMEITLGFELFHRIGKRLTPTERAVSLHEVVERSFIGMGEINRVASAIRDYKATYLRVACFPAYAETVLPQTLRRMLEFSPGAHLLIHCLNEASLHQDVTSQIFDVGLTEETVSHEDVLIEKLEVGNVVAVLPTGHRLCAKPILEPHDFEDVEFVSLAQSDPYRSKLDAFFSTAHVSRRYMLEATTASAVCSMVAAGIGVSIVNPLTAAHYAAQGVQLRPLTQPIPYRIHLWRSGKATRSVLADQFISTLREVIEEFAVTSKLS